MKLLVIRIVMRALSWLTPAVATTIATPIAALLWYVSPQKRRVTLINLAVAYPDKTATEIYRTGRDSMVQYARGIIEAGMLWHWPLKKIFDCFDEPCGQAVLDAAINTGKGVIIATPHAGSWELLGLYMQKVLKGAILYKPGRHPDVEALLLQKRHRGGTPLVPANRAGLRKMYKLLNAGEMVGLLPDQEPSGGDGEFAPLFGIETLTGVLLPRMARRTGAVVVFTVCERRKRGRYCVHYIPAEQALYSDDMRAALTAVNQGIEQCIAVDTRQYLWAYKRFRHRPDGEKSLYK